MAVTVVETSALFLVAALLLAVLAPEPLRVLADRIVASLARRQRGVLVFLVVAVTLACGATAWGILDGFANSADEYAFRFQGWTLAAGRLWNDPPAMLQAESALYVWAIPGKWVGQYPPGWPAFLALGDLLRLPEFVLNALFIGLCTWLITAIVRREGKAVTALLAGACFALSPFALFNGASPFAHPVAAATGLIFTLAALRWLEAGRTSDVAVAGLALGVMAVTRYVPAVPLFLPFAAVVLAHWLRRRPLPGSSVTAILVLTVTVLPFVAALALYHWALTGDPLKTGYWLTGSYRTRAALRSRHLEVRHHPHRVPAGRARPLDLASAPAGYALALLWKLRAGTFRFYDAVFRLSVLLLVSYPSLGGTRWGPRLLFRRLPFHDPDHRHRPAGPFHRAGRTLAPGAGGRHPHHLPRHGAELSLLRGSGRPRGRRSPGPVPPARPSSP